MVQIGREAIWAAMVGIAALLDQPLLPQCWSLLLGGHLRVAFAAKALAITGAPKQRLGASMRADMVDIQRRLAALASLA
jgi:hypothetical protein